MKIPALKNPFHKKRPTSLAFRGGTYSLAVTAVVLALLVVVNILAGALPETVTKRDISSAKLYSVTSSTKAVVNNLTSDVTIYWVVQAGQEDDIIEHLLNQYDSLSDHIKVEKKNPDASPTFTQQYTDQTVENNSLIVVSGERSRYVPYSDIYVYEADMTSYSYSTSFDGEGAITSAIDYVVSEDQPQLYVLEGHGEAELPEKFSKELEKANIETQSLSLLTANGVPEEADCVMIYGPSSDLSDKEKEMLDAYVEKGGKLMVMAGPVEDGSLDTLYSILGDYGVTAAEGIVAEGDREHYAFQMPLALMPDMTSHAITDSLLEERYTPILPLAQGLTVGETPEGATVTSLLTTSESAYSKTAGYALETYDKESGDIDGPFTVGLTVTRDNGGEIVWLSSSAFLEEVYNTYSSGANVNLAMNGVSYLIGEEETLAIRSKSMDYNYLTISDATASLLKVTMIGVLPLVYLGVGIGVVVKRRKMQHDTL